MGRWLGRIAKVGLGVAPVLAFGAQIGPKAATSNLSEWLNLFGLEQTPQWLLSPRVDIYATYIATVILILSLSTLIVLRFIKRRSEESPVNQSPELLPLSMRGIPDQSQICYFGQNDLEVRIAIKFENSTSSERFVRTFSAYIIENNSRIKLVTPSITEVSAQSKTFKIENGFAVFPGISDLYYINFNVSPFVKKDQTFEIEMETLGQKSHRIVIMPNWSQIIPAHLNQNTVIEIRDSY